MPTDPLARLLISTLAFSTFGLLLFALAFWIMGKVTPFSIRKEIEEDQNTALAIVIASVIIGIALIVSAAVHG
jgi:putative membrane protein